MNIQSVVHPKRFAINGMFFEVVSFSPITDEQAQAAAIMFYRSRKFQKADQGKLFRVLTSLGAE